MKTFLELGNQYARESSWKDFALVKLCLCAMGIIIGTRVAPRHRDAVTSVAAGVFTATYIPLMRKVFKLMLRDSAQADTSPEL